MLEDHLRHAAMALLATAVRLAPHAVREWGQAMLAELRHVESGWAAVAWALGGAGVIAKYALISLMIPGRRGESVSPGPGLFAKDVSVRKVALASAGAFVLAALVFFAAPPFRQGLRVSLAPWRAIYRLNRPVGQSELQSFAKRAEARRDPAAMVFAAARLRDARESARLVEEAVRMDPRLRWAYAVVAARHPELPQVHNWIAQLQRRQPLNALFPLITAESIGAHHFANAYKLPPHELQAKVLADPAWQKAMAAVFASSKFDDDLDRLSELDREVVRRYHLNDPYMVLYEQGDALESFALFYNARRFAKSLLQSGEKLEASGDREGAAERFWTVARFGQVIDSQARTESEQGIGVVLQAMAYGRLQTLAENHGNDHEAALFSYLAKQPYARARARHLDRLFGRYVTWRNGLVLQISGLAMAFFSALLVVAAIVLLAGYFRRGWLRRARPGMTAVLVASGAGLLLSSATVYLTYRPYWYIFRAVIESGDARQGRALLNFLTVMRFPPSPRGSHLWLYFPVYFWTGVIFAATAGVMLVLLRHFWEPTRPGQVQPHPRHP